MRNTIIILALWRIKYVCSCLLGCRVLVKLPEPNGYPIAKLYVSAAPLGYWWARNARSWTPQQHVFGTL